jgi:hypothetical protein
MGRAVTPNRCFPRAAVREAVKHSTSRAFSASMLGAQPFTVKIIGCNLLDSDCPGDAVEQLRLPSSPEANRIRGTVDPRGLLLGFHFSAGRHSLLRRTR